MVRILKDLKEKHPDKDLDQLIEMANYSALVHQKKSRAFYRVQATRMMIGAGNILRKHAAEHTRRTGQEDDLATCSHICFESAQYQCIENCGSLILGVVLDGGTGQNTFFVDYCTENGSANAGADFEFSQGTLVFKPGETRKEIKVSKRRSNYQPFIWISFKPIFLCNRLHNYHYFCFHELDNLFKDVLFRLISWMMTSLKKTSTSLFASRT